MQHTERLCVLVKSVNERLNELGLPALHKVERLAAVEADHQLAPLLAELRPLELELLVQYGPLAVKLGRQWAGRVALDPPDAEQEARCALLVAVRSYDGSSEFLTYAWVCVQNHLGRLARRHCRSELTRRYWATWADLSSRTGHCTHDAVVDALALTKRQQTMLVKALNRKTERPFSTVWHGDHRPLEIAAPDEAAPYDGPSLDQIMGGCGLTDTERRVVEAGLNLDFRRGWQTEVAKTMERPGGGFYTRAWISAVWISAVQKLRAASDNLAA